MNGLRIDKLKSLVEAINICLFFALILKRMMAQQLDL
jgi:hypothetical protein